MQVSNAEWQVMKVIWAKDLVTSKEIIESLTDKFDWTASTIKTLISRLVEKKCLSAEMIGHKNYYSPVLSEDESIHQITKEVLEKTCTRNMSQVISELVIQSDFTNHDIDMIEELLKEKRKLSVESVKCNCI